MPAKHAKSNGASFRKKSIATSAALTMAMPIALLPGISQGSDARCLALDDGLTGVTAESLSGGVCQVTFTQSQGAAWTLPSTVTKLSVLGIGGGGGALADDRNAPSVGYAGGGGQYNYVDTVDLTNREFTVTVGAAGTNVAKGVGDLGTSAGNGGNTTLVNGASTTILTAGGGFGGNYVVNSDSAYRYQQDGTLGTKYTNSRGADVIEQGGAGTASLPGSGGAGGAGQTIADQVSNDAGGTDYLDPTLWADDSEILGAGVSLQSFSFGSGGSAATTSAGDRPANSGGGANVSTNGQTRSAAASGILIMRFIIPADVYTVTFNANGGAGSMSAQSASSATNLTANSLTRSGYTFSGWNTAADGSGTAYADAASYAFSASITLYAQWTATTPPAPAPYVGPIPVKLNVSCVPSTGGPATLSGERLAGITSASVNGKAVTVSSVTDTSVKLIFPALEPGLYDVNYVSNQGSLTHADSLRVCAVATDVTPSPEPGASDGETSAGFYVAKRFKNYRGDRGAVVSSDRAAIESFIKANPGLTYVTCVGSTSGVPAIPTDQALAKARAENACSIVEELVPGVKTRLATKTGQGIGQFFRAVSLFGKGL